MRHFRPSFLPTLAVLLLLPLLIGLGVWQLQRADQKRELQQTYRLQSERPAVAVEALDLTATESHYRQVLAQGRYDSEHQILLDNQVYQGQAGYHVYTPLRLATAPFALLINRGWVALGASRQQLPDIAIQDTTVSLQGRLAQPANPPLRLGEPDADTGWPKVVQAVDYPRLQRQLGYPIAPAVLLLDTDSGAGFVRDWQPQFGGFGPERHTGYAVQWFALAATLSIIYIVFVLR